ncbi:autotransporter outer membrane beta-barrel domain-containing protein, partial [Escherichia coli]
NGIRVWRPEAGSYIANLAASSTMFSSTADERRGSVVSDPVTGEQWLSSVWMRTTGGHNEHHVSGGQIRTTANRIVWQLGGDVLTYSFGEKDSLYVGIMGGYGHQESRSRNHYTGYSSRGKVEGYSLGMYGTWYQNEKERTGLYVDSWLLYNWFDNSIKGDGLSAEEYDSDGLTAGLSTGYVWPVFKWMTKSGVESRLYIRPHAEMQWSGVKADEHTEQNGTRVKTEGTNNIRSRVGVRLSLSGQGNTEKNMALRVEPFVEANWIHDSAQYGVTMGGCSTYMEGNRNVAELKVGVEGHLNENLSVWGNVSQLLGGNSYSDTAGMLGVKYTF